MKCASQLAFSNFPNDEYLTSECFACPHLQTKKKFLETLSEDCPCKYKASLCIQVISIPLYHTQVCAFTGNESFRIRVLSCRRCKSHRFLAFFR